MKHKLLLQVQQTNSALEALNAKEFSSNPKAILDLLAPLCKEELYALALALQTDRFHDNELFFYSTCKAWLDSKRIIDLGCGPGFSLAFLNRYFPGKEFFGVDLSPTFVEMASAFHGFSVSKADIAAFKPEKQFDFGIVKAVLQHMSDDSLFLTNLESIIRPNGYALIQDAHPDHQDSSGTFNPTAQTLEKMYSDLARLQTERRFAIRSFVDRAKKNGWEIKDTGSWGVAISQPQRKLAFAKEEMLRCVVITKLLGPTVNPEALHAELVTWLESDNSFATSTGLRVLLQRTTGAV